MTFSEERIAEIIETVVLEYAGNNQVTDKKVARLGSIAARKIKEEHDKATPFVGDVFDQARLLYSAFDDDPKEALENVLQFLKESLSHVKTERRVPGEMVDHTVAAMPAAAAKELSHSQPNLSRTEQVRIRGFEQHGVPAGEFSNSTHCENNGSDAIEVKHAPGNGPYDKYDCGHLQCTECEFHCRPEDNYEAFEKDDATSVTEYSLSQPSGNASQNGTVSVREGLLVRNSLADAGELSECAATEESKESTPALNSDVKHAPRKGLSYSLTRRSCMGTSTTNSTNRPVEEVNEHRTVPCEGGAIYDGRPSTERRCAATGSVAPTDKTSSVREAEVTGDHQDSVNGVLRKERTWLIYSGPDGMITMDESAKNKLIKEGIYTENDFETEDKRCTEQSNSALSVSAATVSVATFTIPTSSGQSGAAGAPVDRTLPQCDSALSVAPSCPVCSSTNIIDHTGYMDKKYGITTHRYCKNCHSDFDTKDTVAAETACEDYCIHNEQSDCIDCDCSCHNKVLLNVDLGTACRKCSSWCDLGDLGKCTCKCHKKYESEDGLDHLNGDGNDR